MKASDYGVFPPTTAGNLMYAKSEDGDGDDLWCDSAATEAEAIEGLRAECDSDLGDQTHGYLADAVEAEIDGPDADRILEQCNEWASERYGEAVDDWPKASKEAVAVLQDRLDKVFGEWLTQYGLWPAFCGIENIRKVEMLPAEQRPDGGNGG